MIKITRLDDSQVVINSDLIEFVEMTPDTIISLTTGKKILVKESVEEVVSRVVQFKRLIHLEPGHNGGSSAY